MAYTTIAVANNKILSPRGNFRQYRLDDPRTYGRSESTYEVLRVPDLFCDIRTNQDKRPLT